MRILLDISQAKLARIRLRRPTVWHPEMGSPLPTSGSLPSKTSSRLPWQSNYKIGDSCLSAPLMSHAQIHAHMQTRTHLRGNMHEPSSHRHQNHYPIAPSGADLGRGNFEEILLLEIIIEIIVSPSFRIQNMSRGPI